MHQSHTPLRVLVIEDSENDAMLTAGALRRAGFDLEYVRVDSGEAMAKALSSREFDLVLSDYALPGFSLWQALEIYRECGCDAPFIVVSGVIGEETAVSAMRSGVHDYVGKGDLRRLIPAVARELREAELRRQKRDADRDRRHSDAMLQLVVDRVPVLLAYIDEGQRYRIVNREHALWFGALPDEIQGREVRSVVGDRVYVEMGPDLEHALAGNHVDRETLFEFPARGSRRLRIRYTPHHDAEGHVVGVFVVGSDITEIVNREAEVSAILDSAADGIVAVAGEGTIESFNPAAEAMFGYAAAEALGMNLSDLLFEARADRDRIPASSILENIDDAGAERELMGLRRTGECFSAAVRITPRVGGVRPGFIGTIQDITERKMLEAQRQQLAERTQRAERLEALGTFAGGIAHDLNNVLAPILMYSTLLESQGLSGPAQQETVDNIRMAATRATDLVHQIVSFASGEQGRRKWTNLAAIAREVVFAQQAGAAAGVDLRLEDDDGLSVYGNPSQLHQCVLNLVVNAVRALHSTGGRVSVRVRRERPDDMPRPPELLPGPYTVLEVEDTGQGISDADRRRIFDPFYSTTRSQGGSGLGLAIVHSIVRAHDGALTVDSEPGRGACFRVYFPASAGAAIGLGPAELCDLEVLIVDDDPAVLNAAASVLEARGMGTEAFASPLTALRCFEAAPHRFDAAILDQHMPELSGLELLERMRSVRRNIPIVLSTGMAAPTLESRATKLRAVSFLRKPYTATQLATTLYELCGRSDTPPPPSPIPVN